jgi:hypothetical protein
VHILLTNVHALAANTKENSHASIAIPGYGQNRALPAHQFSRLSAMGNGRTRLFVLFAFVRLGDTPIKTDGADRRFRAAFTTFLQTFDPQLTTPELRQRKLEA